MGESRQELLAWLNDLLQLNYTKIEQVGTGAAFAQIFDTIYGDVQLSKVKFNTVQEYEYVTNFKVMQKTFTDHKLDKVIPVTRLVKCKFQDNLEFLQWVKKYWDTNFPGGSYDAVARRKGAPTTVSVGMTKGSGSNDSINRKVARAPAPVAAKPNAKPTTVRVAPERTVASKSSAVSGDLQLQNTQLQVTIDGLEKERDFYFGKLRDVEIVIQARLDRETESDNAAEDVTKFCKEIQGVLYSTEEGFEVPQENLVPDENGIMEETF